MPLVIDGALIPIDWVAADGRSTPASTAATEPPGHLRPDGEILWVCGPLPGAVHDLAVAGDGARLISG
jgi:hypothetical protein